MCSCVNPVYLIVNCYIATYAGHGSLNSVHTNYLLSSVRDSGWHVCEYCLIKTCCSKPTHVCTHFDALCMLILNMIIELNNFELFFCKFYGTCSMCTEEMYTLDTTPKGKNHLIKHRHACTHFDVFTMLIPNMDIKVNNSDVLKNGSCCGSWYVTHRELSCRHKIPSHLYIYLHS